MKRKKRSALQELRKSLHLTQEKLGRLLHVSQQTVAATERTGIKKRSTAERYAVVLGCDWKDLLD